MSKKPDLIRNETGNCENIRYLSPLPTNAEALAFLRDNASAVFIPGSIDTRAAGWQLSFPSRLVEYVHTGLPLIIVSPVGTALSNWAKRHSRLCSFENFKEGEALAVLRKITDKEEWLKLAGGSRALAEGEFDPERIQAQFEAELISA
jgi:hypothetical protein